jgi:2-polyprenyl-3-methyl-5-hydroxy-6-metoxy-1,4-benzoquinol methylase
MKDRARSKARQLAHDFIQRGDATGWFEALYTSAHENEHAISWADMTPNPNLVDWLKHHSPDGNGRKALVIGSGLGDDAEELANRGFDVVAFDIAPTAIAWCQKRFPDSRVHYVVADLFKVPAAWKASFDFVLEAYTLQVLPADLRAQAIPHIASCVALGGQLLVICRGRYPEENPGNMPWPLTRAELDLFLRVGLQQVQFEDYLDEEEPPTRRFRVEYRR